MRQKLLTKHCAMLLLALFSTAWSTQAWAEIKIHVRTTSGVAAPNLYVWDNDETPLNGGWPGEVMTTTTTAYDGSTWYVATFNENSVNVIINDGSNQTGNITGINGDRYYEYQGGSTYYNLTNMYIIPSGAVYKDGKLFVYFVNTSQWGTPYAWIYKDGQNFTGGNWPGQPMTKVDGSDNLWSWEADNTGTPTKVIFSDNGSNESIAMDWVNGGYYSTNSLITTINQLQLNATYFPDANFRAALAEALNVNEGDNIYPNNVKVLDVSGKGISNLAGIANFTNLEELYASSNNITYGDFTALHRLRILDVHGNSGLKGFGVMAASNTNPILNLPPAGSNVLEYIDISSCALQYCNQAAFADRVANTLETLIIANNYDHYHFNSVPALNTLSKLKYFDMSGCDATPANVISSFSATQKSTLEYLDLSNNHMTSSGAAQTLDGFTALETFKFGSQASWANTMTITNCPALTHIDVSGNLHMTGLTINNSGITTLNFPEATTLTGLTALTTLNVSNNPFTVLNIPQTPNSLLTVTANDCSLMTRILAEHNKSKLQYVTAHNCPALTDITINGADIYYNKQLNAFDATNKSTLVTLDLSNDAMSTNYALDGFTALQTVDFDNNYMEGNNNNLHEFTATNCPALTTVNLGGNANMQTVTLTNNGFSNISYPLVTVDAGANNVILDFSDNNFSDVPNIQASQINVLKLNNNQLTDINIPTGCNVNYLYAQNNNFGSGDYTLPTTSLVGLDLCNNGFTKFKAENNTSLKSLALAGNTALTEIELHGNTALTQTSPNGIIESDNGLYIKGLSSLLTLNIENSSFNKLGQQNSLEGVTGLKKLQARHNEFTTFTNGVYPVGVQGTGSYRIADPSESSLEHLTGLEYLDLSYNELRDSVHLYRNVALKHLDVSHNNHITGVFDGSITTEAQKTAMLEKKAYHLMKYGNVYQTVGTNPTNKDWKDGYTDFQKRRSRPFDLRTEDLNDTTGLYHLDLGQNVNLEWLDFSYTNIHNTASKPEMMNTGWMDKDWVTDMGIWDARSSSNTTAKRVYTSWHTYVYFIPCSKLKVIHADHNNMQSLGVRYFPELDTLTCSYMYGDCAYMRDFSTNSALSSGTGAITDAQVLIGMGNISLSTTVQKLKSVTWGTDNSGNPTSTLTWEGPGGSANAYYTNPIKYYDVSYSGYNEVRFYPGNTSPDLPNLEHVNVSGNPLNCQVKHYNGATELDYSNVSNYNSLDVTYCPNIRTVLAENCSDLPIVRAHNRTKLDTLYLSNDPNLKTLYVQNDPTLKTNFQGLNTLTGLETLFGYNNTQWGNDISFSSNKALKNLWVSNIGASAIDVSKNTLLEKLRVYDNSLEALNVASNPALTWLDLARNQVPSMDLSANTALQYFNCSNSEETLDDQSLAANNHNGGEADNVKPVTSSHSANDTGNSLSDLVFNVNAPLTDVIANSNDLHKITGNFTNLTNIEFAHNHINGIDLSAATGSPAINSEDNGRAITAECAKFYQHGQFPLNEVTVFYFQLEDINANGQTIDNSQPLASKTSEDSKGDTRYLGRDGFVLDELTAWDASNSAEFIPTNPSGISPKDVTVDPSNMNQYLAEVPGRIVVLKEDPEHPGEGRATYTYNNGKGESEFYLDWTADSSVPTAIENMKIIEGLNIVNTTDGLTVTGVDGTVVGVYDLNGRLVASETISGGTLTIDGLAPGIYVVNGVKVVVK